MDTTITDTVQNYLNNVAHINIPSIVGELLQMAKDHLRKEELEHIKICTKQPKSINDHSWLCKFHTYPTHVYTITNTSNGDKFHFELTGSREVHLYVRLNNSEKVLFAPNVIYDY